MNESEIQIDLLGIPQICIRGERAELPGSRKTRALLGYLLLQGRPVTRTHLCELLWPTPDDPRAALRWSLSKLRPLLDFNGSHLRADRSTVAVTGLEQSVDLNTVDNLLRSPIAEIPTSELESAAGRFHGELLEGHELSDCYLFYEWLMSRREMVRRSHRGILRELLRRHEGDSEHALTFARSLLALDPLDESHHAQVIKLLRGLGRHREARRQMEHCRALLEAELGVGPSPEFLKLAEAFPCNPPQDVKQGPPSKTVAAERETAGLFGRAEECAILEEFLASVGRTDSSPVLLFEGEPGIGKTRLLDELLRRRLFYGVRVLAGRSWEAEMVRPFAAWVDLLAGLAVSEIPGNLHDDIAALVPSLEPAGSAVADEARLFRATTALLEQLRPSGAGLVLVFDDLQWMDASSGALLNFVSRQSAGAIGIVCAGRAGEFADSPAARALLRSWSRRGMLRRVKVDRLADRDAAALARSVRGTPEVESIVSRCGGNPLYLIELARSGDESVPDQMREVLFDRLRSLDNDARECAEWVAVLGREVPARWLEQVTGRDAGELLRSTTALRGHGVLVFREESCDFSHDLMRQATYGQLSGAQRSIMHRHVARVLRAMDEGCGALASDVAYHASRGGDEALAAAAAVSAGERALRFAARDDAYALAQRGLRDLARAGEIRDSLDTRAALLRVMVHAGLGRRDVSLLRRELGALAQEARGSGARAAERSAYYLLSIVAEEAGDFETAHGHSLNAERAGRSADDRTRLAALANTARCLVQLEREPRRARRLLREAEDLAAELREKVLDIPWGRGLLGALEGDAVTARAALEEGARCARRSEDHWAEYECLAGLSRLDLEAGALDAVLRRHPELCAVAGRLGEGSELPFARVLNELALSAQSRADSASLEDAIESLRGADTKGRLAYALNVAAEDDLRRGELRRAIDRAREAREAAEAVGRPVQMARACAVWGMAELARGDRVAATAQRDRVKEDLVRLGPNVGARAHLIRLDATIGGCAHQNGHDPDQQQGF